MVFEQADGEGEPSIVAASVYADGRRIQNITIDEAGHWAQRPGHVVWIGLYEPSHGLLQRLQTQFDLHPLAVEDAQNAHQRPKLERFGESLFIVARTAQIVKRRIEFGETHIFIGKGYVVSVRHGSSTSYSEVRDRCEARPSELAHGEDFIVYALLDFIVDNYRPVIESLSAEVEDIEDRVFERVLRTSDVRRLHKLRRELLRLRNAIVPLSEVCRRLELADVLPIDTQMQPFFRDITDHVGRAQEDIDALRQILAFAFEANTMNAQMQQTEITRMLAAWAAILAVPTAVAGIYGMNFENMPELKWTYGYYIIVGLIICVCAFLFFRFRRAGWL